MVEKENISLKENVIQLRDKLNEATEHIKQMTSEISGQKTVLQEYKDELDKLQEENTALRNQIEDLVNQKNERDVQLDHFSMTLDSKVEELKVGYFSQCIKLILSMIFLLLASITRETN